jgi:hypothetical protein
VGLLAFITNYIPNIGFVLGLIPPALLALLQGGVRQAVLVIVAASGGLQPSSSLYRHPLEERMSEANKASSAGWSLEDSLSRLRLLELIVTPAPWRRAMPTTSCGTRAAVWSWLGRAWPHRVRGRQD